VKNTRAPLCVIPPDFPATIDNRPSLPHIAYRIGAYGDIRAAMLHALDVDPTLAGWTHRQPDDPAIALVEGAAIIGDILTFYQELYANEAYLRTAQWRESVADLVRLLGYRLSPGLGGNASFAISVNGDVPVTMPAAFPIKLDLQAEAGVQMETVAPLTVYPWLNSFNLYSPEIQKVFNAGITDIVVTDDGGLEFAVGDRLLIGIYDPSRGQLKGAASSIFIPGGIVREPQLVTVQKVRQRQGQTVLTLAGPLGGFAGAPSLTAVKLKRTFQHFGYNGPKQDVRIDSGTASATDVSFFRSIKGTTDSGSHSGTTVDPPIGAKTVPLDGRVDDLAQGGLIAVQYQDLEAPHHKLVVSHYTFIATMQSVRHGSQTWGALTGGTTFVDIDRSLNLPIPGSSPGVNIDATDIRQMVMHEIVGPLLTIMPRPDDDASPTDTLYFVGTEQQALSLRDRRVYLTTQRGRAPEIASINAVNLFAHGPLGNQARVEVQLQTIDAMHIDASLYPNEGTNLLPINGNVVDATQGKSEQPAVLGNGDARQTFQTFKLPKAPLTYLAPNGDGVPELRVYVAGFEWQRVDSFFGRGPKEQVYVVRQDADNNSFVQFGDDLTGARLPSGIGNVTVYFRTGIGAFGPIKAGANPGGGARLDGLKSIALAGVVSGGAPEESPDQARDAAPGRVQSLGRVVSIADFESAASGLPGVARARAAWDLGPGGVPAVTVTLLMQSGRDREFDAVQAELQNESRCCGADRFPVIVNEGFFRYVYLVLAVAYDPNRIKEDVEKAVKAALGVEGEDGIDGSHGLFALSQRSFGQAEYASRIEGVVQNVSGVLYCEVKDLGFAADGKSTPDPTTVHRPLVFPLSLSPTLHCPNDRILRLYSVPTAFAPPLVIVPLQPPVDKSACCDG
jgi:hypothetical protein